MDFAAARENMVESQVRPNGITDRRILDAMLAVQRENFVPAGKRSVAYVDEDIDLAPGHGGAPRYLIESMAFARLVQLAAIGSDDRVLHIGAASGYGSAVLARLASWVVALEENPHLAALARGALAGIKNVEIVEGPLAEGYKAAAPFDAIVVEGRVAEVPAALIAQLAEGGRLVAVVGESDMAKAFIWTAARGTCASRAAFDASIAALPGFGKKRPAFVF